MQYYHVASPAYRVGDDLLSWDEQYQQGMDVQPWKWEGEPFDTDVVCLFETIEQAQDMIDEVLPDGILLVVDIPEWAVADGMRMVTVDEGYPAIVRRIPAEFITVA